MFQDDNTVNSATFHQFDHSQHSGTSINPLTGEPRILDYIEQPEVKEVAVALNFQALLLEAVTVVGLPCVERLIYPAVLPVFIVVLTGG
jgi:hypothetical protein